ncbi:hypothetical protein BS47DRAFT_1358694 [Hydnum rufescens UP504]|uniref:Uncharacterized protein n=1 Tax=Hydnum rufescens UP504 TaxID=1448309 RepID=A0A9P6DYL9_9AGAM|nr:hypothetical protein BS47DRAFT_1358694 [Hydnum rufescens UP504]
MVGPLACPGLSHEGLLQMRSSMHLGVCKPRQCKVETGWSTTLTTYVRSYNTGAPLGPKSKVKEQYQCNGAQNGAQMGPKWGPSGAQVGPKWGPNGTQVDTFKLPAPMGPKCASSNSPFSSSSELPASETPSTASPVISESYHNKGEEAAQEDSSSQVLAIALNKAIKNRNACAKASTERESESARVNAGRGARPSASRQNEG